MLSKKRTLPPGPTGVPVLGNLLAFRRDPTTFLTQLAHEYGDIACFRLASQLAFQFNHPDLIRDVLVTHSQSFEKTRVLDRAKRVIGNGLLTSEGEFHRRQRRLAQPAFARQRIAAYGSIMTECARQASDRWEDGALVNMSVEMLRLTLTIVGRTLFGTDIEKESNDIGWAMTVVFEHFNRLMLPFAGILDHIPLPNRRRFQQARTLLDRTVYGIIKERRASGEDRGDLLSKLLLATDDEGDGMRMAEKQVRDEIMTMFLAGHETTATWLTWTWYLLATNSVVHDKLIEELDSVLGERLPTVDDVERLEYARMILTESLRIYPPVWTLTRRALVDYHVDGFVVPAGSIVGMSQYVMHRDARYYRDPEVFDPLRWSKSQVEARHRFTFFPFGGGPRLCIGEGFAWMEATLLLATLCHAWRGKVAPGWEVAFQPLITLRPKGGLPMVMQRRASAPERPYATSPECNPATVNETQHWKARTA